MQQIKTTGRVRVFDRSLRNEVRRNWALLESEGIEHSQCEREELIKLLLKRYGLSRQRAEREIDRLLSEVSERLRLAV